MLLTLTQARRLIVNLVQRKPSARWPAAMALRNALFDSAEDTDQRLEAWGKMAGAQVADEGCS